MTILQKHLVFIPLFLVVVVGLLGAAVMWLWNWLMPDIFQLGEINFWQAVGLVTLSKILFGGIGLGGHHHGHGHGHCGCGHGQNRLRERWEQLTPEERQRIVEMHNCDKTFPGEDGR